MKAITFNQLQLGLLTVLFFLFTSTVFSYRYFIELPKLEDSISQLSERELDTLSFSVSSKLDILSRVNFDYAVWTSSYEFIRNPTGDYIEENAVDNTFISMELDGIFYLDETLKTVYVKGFHHTELTNIDFSFYDFISNPHNLGMLPAPTHKNGAPQKVGFINTIHGPAMFSTTQIRDSEMNGEHRGFLIMVHLLGNEFIADLSKYTLTNIEYTSIPAEPELSRLRHWDDKAIEIDIQPYNDILLTNSAGMPVTVLRMQHSIGEIPSLINDKSLLFTIIISFLFYVVYLTLSLTIIDPVKKLATDIKDRDNLQKYDPLDELYMVVELATVSENVNQLMLTVQQQNDILSKQANTDQLTKILNRRGLIKEMEVHQELCIRKSIGFIVVMADIDNFKAYNDSVGHLEGDTALYEVAQLLNEHCQRSGDVCARYGGEEFTLLFSDMSEQHLNQKLQSILKGMKALGLPHPCSVTADYITISMGAVIIKATDVNNFELPLSDIFREADRALYEAKHQGRNRFVIKN